MESFLIDTIGYDGRNKGDESPIKIDHSDEDVLLNCPKIELIDELSVFANSLENGQNKKTKKRSDINLHDVYFIESYKPLSENVYSNVEKLMEKSIYRKGLEQCHSLPSEKTRRALKLEGKNLKEKTKGKKWFDMPATELTEEIKTDFELLKMRKVLERKPVYKKNNITRIPKYFQVGKVIESSADFYGGRIPKSHRKNTMVDELLGNAEFKKYQKKKFIEIMNENRRKKKKNVFKRK